MSRTTRIESFDIAEQIEEAQNSLDRINGWITSCDTKAGTILALVGVLLTLIFTNDGLATMYGVCQKVLPPKTFCVIIFILLFGASAVMLFYGIAHLIFSLVAKIDSNVYNEPGLVTDSILFFGSIAKRPSYQVFQRSVLNIEKKEYLMDILSQIYINSQIANKKHEYYNRGIKWTFIGFIAFILLFLIGICLYGE